MPSICGRTSVYPKYRCSCIVAGGSTGAYWRSWTQYTAAEEQAAHASDLAKGTKRLVCGPEVLFTHSFFAVWDSRACVLRPRRPDRR